METTDRDPIIAICLLAALADGRRTVAEQEEFARIRSRLGGGDGSEAAARVQSGELTVSVAARQLSSDEARRLAYEMAVTMVYADGDATPKERAFLDELKQLLGLRREATAVQEEARLLAEAPLLGPTPSGAVGGRDEARPSQAGIPAMSHDTALDLMIRQQALLAGALELLPQNLASLAILPIQMRLVYRIGADYGQKLDGTQIKDLLGAMGIGAAVQLLDRVARRLMASLGGAVGGVAGILAGAGVAFVATYALGHAAKQYYAQGRRLSQADLRALFERFRAEAEALVPTVREEIQAQAEKLDLPGVLATVRGIPRS